MSPNAERALHWFKQAAQLELPEAEMCVGECLSRGRGARRDEGEAAWWFERAAQRGFVPAQAALGFAYLKGNGVSCNLTMALKWLREAAVKQDAVAQCCIGVCYAKGEGVAADLLEAIKWFVCAAQNGCREALFNLSLTGASPATLQLKPNVSKKAETRDREPLAISAK
jgi:TPR repeat protein